jgi:hypothetical protein
VEEIAGLKYLFPVHIGIHVRVGNDGPAILKLFLQVKHSLDKFEQVAQLESKLVHV